MAEQATAEITVNAPVERCYETLLDFERYPEWAPDVKEAVVAARDEEGRGTEVDYRAAAMGRSTHYRLRYDHSGAPHSLAWHLVEGDLMRRLDGSYTLRPAGDGDATEVTYHLEIDLRVPLPGFVKRRAETRIMRTALRGLKRRAES